MVGGERPPHCHSRLLLQLLLQMRRRSQLGGRTPRTRPTPGTPGLAHGLPPAFPRVCRDSVAKVAAAWVVLRQEGVAAIAAAVAAAVFFREN